MKYLYKSSIEKLKPYTSESRSDKDPSWLKLDWNESTFPLDVSIKSKLSLNILEQEYPGRNYKLLKSKISQYTGANNETILIYSGSDEALRDIFTTFLDHTKTCLVVTPTYNQVFTYIFSNTENIILNNIKDPLHSHKLNLQKENIQKADLIYLANPNNPTGKLFSQIEILKILNENPEKIVVVDEAYYEYANNSLVEYVSKYNNLIITRTFSKAFSLAGLRLGYLIANQEVINLLKKIKNIKSVNSYATQAGCLILDNIPTFQSQIREVNQAKEELLNKTISFKKTELLRSDTNFLLIRAENIENLKNHFLDNKIIIRDKSVEEGLENCIRITVGSKQINDIIYNVLESYENTN